MGILITKTTSFLRERTLHSLLAGMLVAALACGPSLSFAQSDQDTAPAAATVASVTVAQVAQAQMIARVAISGTLVPKEEVLIYPQVNGSTIDSLAVDIGDRVEAGAVLATLNASTLTAQLAKESAEFSRSEAAIKQAQSQITSAQATATRTASTLDRTRRLRDAGTATQATLDQALADAQTADAAVASAQDGLAVAQAQLQQAQAQVDIAALDLDRATLQAPVAGLISARNGQIGAIATSGGEPIFRIITDGILEVEAEVIETALGQITNGDTAQLSIAGVGDASGKVRQISPTVDPVNRLGTIRMAVAEQDGLRSGIFASGWITTQERMSLTVPTTAVLTDTDGTFVMVVKDGVLEKRKVTAGLIWNGLREVVEGLTDGETVVAKAGAFFRDGDRVKPIPSASEGASK